MAYLFLRLLVGLNLAMHGIARLAAGAGHFASALLPEFAKTPLPAWSVYLFGITLPWVEAMLGLLLLFGLRTRAALIGSLLAMLALTFGTTLRQDWPTAATQLLYGLVYAVLLAFAEYNRYSVDGWMQRDGRTPPDR
jgi:thiosulfate dehydrogenase [quinone] large subunit